ncbi:RHS repeat-associated core domain-containing protein [Pseudomonas fluorescens group sp. PF-1]
MSQSKQPWLIRYHYDPLDQITSHTVPDTAARHRFYCKNRLTTEIQGAVGYSIVQHDDLLLAQQLHQQDIHDSTLLATDLQRSALHTLKRNAQPQPIAYSPYGYRSAESALLSFLGFNGERPDSVTGHYLLGSYRAFNPVLMRFNSPDSLSPFGKGGLNAYGYCMGDPINHSDRNGHSPLPNFLSNLFQRVRNTLGIPKKFDQFMVNTTISTATTEFISGPTITFTDAIETATTTKFTISTGRDTVTSHWKTYSEVKDFTGKKISSRMVYGKDGLIWGNYNEKKHFSYSATPSLKELAYKSVPGKELKDLGIKAPWMSVKNFYNAHAEYLNVIKNVPLGGNSGAAIKQLSGNVRRGEIMGVHPDYRPFF